MLPGQKEVPAPPRSCRTLSSCLPWHLTCSRGCLQVSPPPYTVSPRSVRASSLGLVPQLSAQSLAHIGSFTCRSGTRPVFPRHHLWGRAHTPSPDRGFAPFTSACFLRDVFQAFPKRLVYFLTPEHPALFLVSPSQIEYVNGVETRVDPTRQGLRSGSKSALPFRINGAALHYVASCPLIALPHPSCEDPGRRQLHVGQPA